MKVWGSQPNIINQKSASHFFFNSLAGLVRQSQAQKCLQIKLPTGCYEILKISNLTEFSTNRLTD